MADTGTVASQGLGIETLGTLAMRASQHSTDLRCCCGRDQCAFLKHNCTILDSVEKDVHEAARMGQALLVRHEAYMASAEVNKVELESRIEHLETEKFELDGQNKRTIEDNRQLLDQLEHLNGSAKDSDTRIQSLEATLRDSQLEIRRLETARARASDMERHIALLEDEQDRLRHTLSHTEEESRTALCQWRKAHREVAGLEEQLRRMEKEAAEERERHAEVMGRLERQRAMEKDLNTAAGRLKGAAASKSMDGKKGGSSSVVNHFVRDILQDNANLQAGFVELRELLRDANDEIQLLREQLLYHQSSPDGEASAASTLRAELEKEGHTPRLSQELHIHHHYHVLEPEAKKSPKKRQGLSSAMFMSPQLAASQTPEAGCWQSSPPSPTRAPSSHSARASTSTISAPSNPRWSLISDHPSDFAASTVPSSPVSNHMNSVFDRAAEVPMSPISSVESTTWQTHSQKASIVSTRSFQTSSAFSPGSRRPQHTHCRSSSVTQSQPHPLTRFIREEDLLSSPASAHTKLTVAELAQNGPTTDAVDSVSPDNEYDDPMSARPIPSNVESPFDHAAGHLRTLRRVASHESIISLSNGMDIHTLRGRPSQKSLRPIGHASAATGITVVQDIHVAPRLSGGTLHGKRSSVFLRDNFSSSVGLGLPMPRARATSNRVASGPVNANGAPRISPIGRLVSWRPWASTTERPHQGSTSPPTAAKQSQSPTPKSMASLPSRVLPGRVDTEALRELLEE